ncbi:YfhO family protein [Solirubrobacter sp. CPCC 204708]|uniref:YfhO family protein n=1 Tax=Solirubrobacter deserti TaxID=2282478 RepID=A0ABT4RSR4_9ACTN|nr:YfhO family protein [Solirubrobacter deserti]MBE2316393.1 YfhO family protein [Solirubrobacter deserti]MDA0141527.1 YfhO family protein [Solirubrobacter deserti]
MKRHPLLAAALLYALLALAFVSPALVPGKVLSNSDELWFEAPWGASRPADLIRPANPELGDAPEHVQPFLREVKRSLPEIPLWNPYIQAGRPTLANSQSAVFSPFNAVVWVMDAFTALAWQAILKFWVAAFGAFLLARALNMRWPGALLAGLVYGFSLWMVTWVSYPHVSVWAMIPWALAAADGVMRRPDLRRVALFALVIAIQFLGGHPESSFHLLVATVVFCALRRPGWRTAAWLVAGGVWGAALAALVLLPAAELVLRSADLEQRAGEARHIWTSRKFALGVMVPFYWGKPTQTPLDFFLLARAFYGGALPLLLAGIALLRPTRERVAAAVLGVACMAVVLGVPPVFQLVTALPVFSSGHNTRLAVLYLLCLALLAGWGLDDVVRRGVSRRVLLVGVAVLLFPVAYTVVRSRSAWDVVGEAVQVAFGFADAPAVNEPDVGFVVRGAAVVQWLVVGGAGLLVLAWRRNVAVAALVVVFADLAWAGVGYNPAIPREHAIQPSTPAIEAVAAVAPARFVSIGAISQNSIPMDYAAPEARGYDLPVDKRFDRLWRAKLSPEFPSQVGPLPAFIPLSLPKVDAERLRFLSLLGVSRVLQPVGDPELRVPGLRVVHDGPDARVYANEGALPRAMVVGARRPAADSFAAITAPGFDARREVIVEGGGSGGAPGPAGAARIVALERNRVVVEARADRTATLVLTDNWYPGWKARVDGEEVDVERVDYTFRGVALPAGASRVEFVYAPLSWRVGWIVSLLALVGLVGAFVWRR